jgi:hypothetical protein
MKRNGGGEANPREKREGGEGIIPGKSPGRGLR